MQTFINNLLRTKILVTLRFFERNLATSTFYMVVKYLFDVMHTWHKITHLFNTPGPQVTEGFSLGESSDFWDCSWGNDGHPGPNLPTWRSQKRTSATLNALSPASMLGYHKVYIYIYLQMLCFKVTFLKSTTHTQKDGSRLGRESGYIILNVWCKSPRWPATHHSACKELITLWVSCLLEEPNSMLKA